MEWTWGKLTDMEEKEWLLSLMVHSLNKFFSVVTLEHNNHRWLQMACWYQTMNSNRQRCVVKNEESFWEEGWTWPCHMKCNTVWLWDMDYRKTGNWIPGGVWNANMQETKISRNDHKTNEKMLLYVVWEKRTLVNILERGNKWIGFVCHKLHGNSLLKTVFYRKNWRKESRRKTNSAVGLNEG